MYNQVLYDFQDGDNGEEYGYEDVYRQEPLPEVLIYNLEEYEGYYDEVYELPPAVFELTFPGPAMITSITAVLGLFLALFLIYFAGSSSSGLAGSAVQDQSMPLSPAMVSGNPLPLTAEDGIAFQPSAEAAAASCVVSDMFPDKVRRWCNLISFYAVQKSLNPDLVAAVIWLESGGNEVAYSKSGAVGLMQVMPQDGLAASFMCANGPCFSDRPTTTELQNPEFNIKYGTKMLSQLLVKSGDVREALRSYGPMNVGYYYADKVLGLFNQYGKTP